MTEEAMETTALAVQGQGSPLPVFSGAMMTKALVAYKELQDALDRAMPDCIMELDGRKFRKKNFWRAVRVSFGLTVEPTEERREISGEFNDGRDNFGYVVTYRATAPNGCSATGDGACFAVEKARRFKCPHPEREGSRRTLHFPHNTCPDFDPEFSWRALPGDATEHNVRSHAHTRAFNRAVSNLVGFGEVSAEEVIREEHSTSADDPSRSEQPSKPAVSPDGVTTVKAVSEKTGGSAEKPWTRTDVTFADGRRGATFDKKIGELAKAKLASKERVVPDLKQGDRGMDLKGLGDPPKAPEPEAPQGPEKVLMLRVVQSGEGKKWWVCQGSEKEYVTDQEVFAKTLEDVRVTKASVIFRFVPVPTAKGTARNITALEDPPTAPIPAAPEDASVPA